MIDERMIRLLAIGQFEQSVANVVMLCFYVILLVGR